MTVLPDSGPAPGPALGGLVAVVALFLGAACSRLPPTLTLRAECVAGGHVDFAVSGPRGALVLVALAPPRRGDEQVLPALVGSQCSTELTTGLREAGAGTQLGGVLGDAALAGRIEAATLARLPSTMVLQAVGSVQAGGEPEVAVSNALVVATASDGSVEVRPFTTAGAIVRALPRLFLIVAVALTLVAALGFVRRLPPSALPVLVLIVLLLRLSAPNQPALLPTWCDDEIEQLDAYLGGGFAEALDFVAAPERSDAPLWFRIGTEPVRGSSVMRAHWLRLLPRTMPWAPEQDVPKHGLLVAVATPEDDLPGELLLRTRLCSIWGLGGQK